MPKVSDVCLSFGVNCAARNVFWNFGFKSTQRLWSTLETALGSHQGENTVTVFDRLIEEVSSEMHERLNPI